MRNKILSFVRTYHPALPNLKNILRSKWLLIQNQLLLREIFKDLLLFHTKQKKTVKKSKTVTRSHFSHHHTTSFNMSRVWPVNTSFTNNIYRNIFQFIFSGKWSAIPYIHSWCFVFKFYRTQNAHNLIHYVCCNAPCTLTWFVAAILFKRFLFMQNYINYCVMSPDGIITLGIQTSLSPTPPVV